MLRRTSRRALLVCIVSLCGLTARTVVAQEDDDGATRQLGTFAIRPKFGVDLIAKGHLKNEYAMKYKRLNYGELGLKGTYKHFGLEFALGGKRRDLVKMGAVKLTGSYEFNPLAGLTGHEYEGNLYFGSGIGFYPLTIEDVAERDWRDDDGFGYGVHLVAGGEYFFTKHLAFVAELQYSYTDFDMEARSNINHFAFAIFGGLAFKF